MHFKNKGKHQAVLFCFIIYCFYLDDFYCFFLDSSKSPIEIKKDSHGHTSYGDYIIPIPSN